MLPLLIQICCFVLAGAEAQPPVMSHKQAKLSVAVSALERKLWLVLHWGLGPVECPMETLSVRSNIAMKLAHHGEASSLIARVALIHIAGQQAHPKQSSSAANLYF